MKYLVLAIDFEVGLSSLYIDCVGIYSNLELAKEAVKKAEDEANYFKYTITEVDEDKYGFYHVHQERHDISW